MPQLPNDEMNQVLREIERLCGYTLNINFNETQKYKGSIPMSNICYLESKHDALIVCDHWNMINEQNSADSVVEDIILQWRILSAISIIESKEEENIDTYPETIQKEENHNSIYDLLAVEDDCEEHFSTKSISFLAYKMVENNRDPIAKCVGKDVHGLHHSLRQLLNITTKMSNQQYKIHQFEEQQLDIRNIYSFLERLENKETDRKSFSSEAQMIYRMFARYGIKTKYWLDFCDAFVCAFMKINQTIDNESRTCIKTEDRGSIHEKNALFKFAVGMIALPIIEGRIHVETYLKARVFDKVKSIYEQKCDSDSVRRALSHKLDTLLSKYTFLTLQVTKEEVYMLVVELIFRMEKVVNSGKCMIYHDSDIRKILTEFGEQIMRNNIDLEFFILVVHEYIDTIQEVFQGSIKFSSTLLTMSGIDATYDDLSAAFKFLIKEAFHFIVTPIIAYRNLCNAASQFYNQVAQELDWTKSVLEERKNEVISEIKITGSYTQSKEEIETGARLYWRKSNICKKRTAWKTLQIRDRRHVFSAEAIFQNIKDHFDTIMDQDILNTNDNITPPPCIMTVFRPQIQNEIMGIRFLSSHLFQYAGYMDKENGIVLGDPSNVEYTNYLIETNLWSPPSTRGAYDLLPLVLKMPHIDKPFVYILPRDITKHEVVLEHARYPGVKGICLKCAPIPFVMNYSMNLGGLVYPCAPFNGCFSPAEKSSTLLYCKKYGIRSLLGNTMGYQTEDKIIEQSVALELEQTILNSFEKKWHNILDYKGFINSYKEYCAWRRSLRKSGEIIGKTINLLLSQLSTKCKEKDNINLSTLHLSYVCKEKSSLTKIKKQKHCRLLIAFGSETGTARAIATSLACKLEIFQPELMALNDIMMKIDKISCDYLHLIVIYSTFGGSDVQTDAKKLLEAKELKGMINVSFTVLALGSGSYPKICQVGTDINEKLTTAGGRSMMKMTFMDRTNEHDQQRIIGEWSNKIAQILSKKFSTDESNILPVKSLSKDVTFSIKWDTKCRVGMKCRKNYELFTLQSEESNRSTRCIEFTLPSGWKYETGDHLSVHPVNDLKFVKRLLNCFQYELETIASNLNFRHVSPHPSKYGIFMYDDDDDDSTQPINENSFTDTFSAMSYTWAGVSNLSPKIQIEKMGSFFPTKGNEGDLSEGLMPFSSKVHWLIHQPCNVYSSVYGKEAKDDEPMMSAYPHLNDITLWELLQSQLDLSLCRETFMSDLLSMMMEKLKKSPLITSLVSESKKFIDFYNNYEIKRMESRYPTIVHLLEEFGSIFCEPHTEGKALLSLADVLDLMPRLIPQYYSISSSARCHPEKVAISVGIVKTKNKDGVKIEDVCSNYLANLQPGDIAKVRIRTSKFRSPTMKTAPMILIGTGTGIAPLMGLLRDRAKELYSSGKRKKMGQCHLYFGCRSIGEVLYIDEITSYQAIKIMRLHLALSREPNLPKKYVQDQLRHNSKEVNRLIQKRDLHLYICGNGSMATSCIKTCIHVLTNEGGMSYNAAVKHMKQMKAENRLQFDVNDGNLDLSILRINDHKYPLELLRTAIGVLNS